MSGWMRGWMSGWMAGLGRICSWLDIVDCIKMKRGG